MSPLFTKPMKYRENLAFLYVSLSYAQMHTCWHGLCYAPMQTIRMIKKSTWYSICLCQIKIFFLEMFLMCNYQYYLLFWIFVLWKINLQVMPGLNCIRSAAISSISRDIFISTVVQYSNMWHQVCDSWFYSMKTNATLNMINCSCEDLSYLAENPKACPFRDLAIIMTFKFIVALIYKQTSPKNLFHNVCR